MVTPKVTNDKYTLSVINLIAQGYDIFDFDYPLKEHYKCEFQKCFIDYFMFSEICYYMPRQWQQRLRAHMWVNSYYYNKLFDSVHLKYDPLLTVEIKNSRIKGAEKVNRHNFDSMQKEYGSLWESQKNQSVHTQKRNEIETGETTGMKDSTGNDSKTQNIVDLKDLTRNTIDDGTLDKNVDTTSNEDSTQNVVTSGDSDKTSHLEEVTKTNSVHRIADTPQNHLDTLGGGSSPAGLFSQYLSQIEDTNTTQDHDADSTEHIENRQTTDTTGNVDKTGNETTKQTTHNNQDLTQKETGNNDLTHNIDTTYHEDTRGTHQFTNDQKVREKTINDGTGVKDTRNSSENSGSEYYLNSGKENEDVTMRGFQNTSLSKLIVEYRESLMSVMQTILSDFEPLFMGIL